MFPLLLVHVLYWDGSFGPYGKLRNLGSSKRWPATKPTSYLTGMLSDDATCLTSVALKYYTVLYIYIYIILHYNILYYTT